MAIPPSAAGAPGQEPNPAVYPTSDAIEYPPIEYDPTPPPGYSLPPMPLPVPPRYLPPAAGQSPPGYPAYGASYVNPAGTNGMAVGALVCSLVGPPAYFLCFGFVLSILGIVLGIIALNQVNQSHQKGKEMAIAAIVIGGVGLVGMGVFIASYF